MVTSLAFTGLGEDSRTPCNAPQMGRAPIEVAKVLGLLRPPWIYLLPSAGLSECFYFNDFHLPLEHYVFEPARFSHLPKHRYIFFGFAMAQEDLEKSRNGLHMEQTVSADSNNARLLDYTADEQKRIVRKVDLRLVSTLGVLYCASLMDRTNLGSAAIAG